LNQQMAACPFVRIGPRSDKTRGCRLDELDISEMMLDRLRAKIEEQALEIERSELSADGIFAKYVLRRA
jgi:hypothetical protein